MEQDKKPNYIDIIIMRHQQKITGASCKQLQELVEEVLSVELQKPKAAIQQNTDYIAFLEEQLGDSCNWYEEFEASKTK